MAYRWKRSTRPVELGVHVHIDSVETLQVFARTHPGVPVGIRITPEIFAGGHAKISVGGRESKFGIPLERMDEVEELAKREGLPIVGVHLHTGSDIYDVDVFLEGAEPGVLRRAAFPGGIHRLRRGFKVPYGPG